jgi:hypothetical protein
MTVKTVLSILLVCIVSMAPGLPGETFAGAIPVPAYFDGERVGLLCLDATPLGSSPIKVLVQFNYDPAAGGGISVTAANQLFGVYTSFYLGILSPLIGPNPQPTCSLIPSIVAGTYGVDALDAVQILAGTYQQSGFHRYYIVDSYRTTYAGGVESVIRSEVFRVEGPDTLTFELGIEIAVAVL